MRIFLGVCIVMLSGLLSAQEQTIYRPGNGVTLPVVTKQVTALYTQEAMDAHIEGTVGLEVVVPSRRRGRRREGRPLSIRPTGWTRKR